MGFEIFTRKVSRMISPAITFNPLGRISLNSASTKLLEKDAVEFVLLLWDKDRLSIAIRPIRKKDTRTYHVSYGKKGNGAGFSAKTFLDYIGYDYSKTHAFPVVWNDAEGQLETNIPLEHFKKEIIKPALVESVRRTK
jgi:hypothetical protein